MRNMIMEPVTRCERGKRRRTGGREVEVEEKERRKQRLEKREERGGSGQKMQKSTSKLREWMEESCGKQKGGKEKQVKKDSMPEVEHKQGSERDWGRGTSVSGCVMRGGSHAELIYKLQ